MYFLVRDDTKTYLTIHKEDEQNFKDLVNSNYFHKENKFRLVKDRDEIRQILEDNFSSKNRGEEYTTGLPSATLISSALFPYNLDSHVYGNKIALLRWHNDTDFEDLQNQKVKNKLSTDSGTLCHKVLELSLQDKKTRTFDKQKNIKKYIEKACEDKEIVKTIENFDTRKDYFESMSMNTLNKFFKNEIKKLDPIFDELFLKNEYIQGSIDLVAYRNGELSCIDFKTSKHSMSQKQAAEKGYLRQLYIYSRMLLRAKVISPKEYENLKFVIYFWNWNSGNSAVYEYDKKEIDRNKGYVDFILSWYWSIKNGKDIKIEL